MIHTNAGFTGGSVSNPSYEEVCAGRTGSAEAVRVIFDRARVSYEELLATFWEIHDPTQVGHQGFDSVTRTSGTTRRALRQILFVSARSAGDTITAAIEAGERM